MARITYEDKVKVRNSNLPAKNTVRDVDLNEIKESVNSLYDTVDGVESDLTSKENTANKQDSLTVDGTGVKFPTVDAVNAALDEIAPIVVSANQTAENNKFYHVVATATFTDPSPIEGKGFTVFVRNGTATIGGTAYVAGSYVLRTFHSGAWANKLLSPGAYAFPNVDGTSGQVPQTNGAGVVTWQTLATGITVGTTAVTSGTVGRVFFQGTGDVVQQSGSLFWDNTNSRLGVGATPATTVRLDVRAQGALSTDIAFRVRNSANTQNSFEINGLGQGRIKSTGFTPRFAVGYDWFGAEIDAFIFTQNLQNFRGQSWTFDAGYNGVFEGLQISNDLTGNNKGLFTIQLNNYCFGTNMLSNDTGQSERRVLRIANGVAPTTSKADEFKFYSADIVAGNAAPHFRTENGSIVKLYQETTGVAAATLVSGGGTALTDTDTFDGYTLKQIVKALRNNGLLA
jgi:hypothetical protein